MKKNITQPESSHTLLKRWIFFIISLVCLAIVSSLIFTHHIQGVREGTLAAAICVGLFSRQILKPLRKFAAKHLDA